MSTIPLYQFHCACCGHDFEELTAIDRHDEVRCPNCGEKARRVWMGKGAFGPMKYTDEKQACEKCPHQCPMHR